MTKNCPQCKKDFETLYPTKVTYCSRKCGDLSRRKYNNCVSCKKDFYSKDKRTKTCSRECYKKFKNKDRIGKTCTECKSEYTVPTYRSGSRFCSEECRVIGFKAIDRSKEKIPQYKCDNCDNMIYRTKSTLKSLNFCSYDCMGEYYSKSKMFSGENNGAWNGGKITYYGKNWLSQRRLVRSRDNYTCQKCGIDEEEYGQEMSVHHIKPFMLFDSYIEANREDNLICVCEPCHRKIHSGDNHPSKFLKKYQKEST